MVLVDGAFIQVEPELSELCGEAYRHHPLDQFFLSSPVFDQILYCDDSHIEFLCHLQKSGQTGHSTVVIHYFAQDTCRTESCQSGQIHSCLGMSGSAQYPTVHGLDGKDVSRFGQIFWSGFRVDQGLYGLSSIMSGDAGSGIL